MHLSFNSMVRAVMCVAVFAGALGATAISPATAQAHEPRLFVTAERIAQLRQAVQQRGSHHQEAYQAMRQRVETGWRVYQAGFHADRNHYLASWHAREASMMYLLTDDRRYAQLAVQTLREQTQNAGTSGSGLERAMVGLGYAITYDWAGGGLSDADRKWLMDRMNAALDAWPRFGHANLGHTRGSNWVAVCRGGELILLLGARQDDARQDRLNMLKRELERHIDSGYGSMAVTQEGVGYKSFAAAFLYPAALALQSVGDRSLADRIRRMEPWKQLMYAGTFGYDGDQPIFLQSGVSRHAFYEEGWASLTLAMTSSEAMPYYMWFYDRHVGKQNSRKAANKYDSHRAGTTWALLYYPTNVQPKDPTSTWPKAVGDNRGYYFFRNRFEDVSDIQFSIMADAHHHRNAWNQPEATQLNLMAFGNHFIGGPRQLRDAAVYSTLHVNGKNHEGGTDTGQTVHFEPTTRGGYAIVGGGEKYRNLGLNDLKRHAHVDFAPDANTAVISTLDQITSSRSHTYTWNANLGPQDDDGGIRASHLTEAGRPVFLLQGSHHNGYVKGWVLHPANARVQAERGRLQVTTHGSDTQIWIALYVGQGRPVTAQITGTGLGSTLQVEGTTVRYHPGNDRITIER